MRLRRHPSINAAWILAFAFVFVLAFSGCGGGNHSSSHSMFTADAGRDGGGGDATVPNDAAADATVDGMMPRDSATILGGDGSMPGPCKPETCTSLGYNCGQNGDGCGNLLDCGTCVAPQFCGAGGFSVCGGNEVAAEAGGSACVPKTCHDLGFTCGAAGDGCGNTLSCGTCMSPQFCGGGGFSSCGGDLSALDGGSPCTPTTCQALGVGCGQQGDGCGNIIDCGSCAQPQTCGGGGTPNVCGGATPTCTNLCHQQVLCSDGGVTSISGTVTAATNTALYGPADPVPNVVVYVPNSQVLPFAPGVQCNQCGADISGDPLVQTTTAVDGTFTLANVPVMSQMPLVIQLGRWRKQLTVTQTTACQNTAVGKIAMPKDQGEGDIPLTAISTGNVDAIECVLLKMGVDPSEFTMPPSNGGTGRIQIFVGNGANEGFGDPPESALVDSVQGLNAYDEVLFPCWGDDPTLPGSVAAKTPAQQANLLAYVNAGGRAFATHYSYGWLYNDVPFSQTAAWDVNFSHYAALNATIDVSSAETMTFASWMQLIGAAPIMQFNVTLPYHDFDSVIAPSQRWVYTTDEEGFPLQYTFDTPIGSANHCGRVVFSDFHVTNSTPAGGQEFPTECTASPLTAQERALEYLLWDLDSCVPAPGPACQPLSCAAQNIACGPAGDGCGNLQQCGTCTLPQTCGGGGQLGHCGYVDGGSCVPSTCAAQGIACGPAADGCGGLLQCGTCTPPQQCGGGGTPGQCGSTDGGSCAPATCTQLGVGCGPAGDGCGNLLQCGTCASPQTCGGGGKPGVCGGGGSM